VVIVVDEIPANTPAGEPIHVAGNFNRWDPGDTKYQMVLTSDSVYTISLPPGFGEVEYKFTRGDWRSVETDQCGMDINNRVLTLSHDDTIHHRIESWHDLFPLNCESMILIVNGLPENTPADAQIYFLTNMNNWSLWDNNYLMRRNANGTYEIKIPKRPGQQVEFKFTRGDWSTQEVDRYGYEIQNRQLLAGNMDTVFLQIENWKDLSEEQETDVTLIVTSLPATTPDNATLFVAGNFNGWNEHDSRYRLAKSDGGFYTVQIPRRGNLLEFKFTRGNWGTVEADNRSRDISNRTYFYREIDTLRLEIIGWHDR
jgi:1,4-alpha-glucan branching enzyme